VGEEIVDADAVMVVVVVMVGKKTTIFLNFYA
jgi:hypothetical protein